MMHIVEESVMDSVRLIPFLFLTYLLMEYWEHKAGERSQRLIGRAGKIAPVLGGLLGAVPQCGFSAAAAGLYAGGVISLGTLMAIFLSTSDEMLPILLSEKAPAGLVLGILLAKAVFGMAAGLTLDFILRKKGKQRQGGGPDICRKAHCHCGKGVLCSALAHTARIVFFLLLVTFALNLVLELAGEDALAGLVLNRPVLGPLVAGLVGMIPNCAGSVVVTRLYLEGAMGLGAAMAGLLAGSGVGLLVLFRVNGDLKENLKITALLYGLGVGAGIAAELLWKL